LIKNSNLPIPRPLQRIFKLQKKTSALRREHQALQNMKFLNFLRVIFSLLDPYPNPDSGSGYRSTDLIESGSETLPECKFLICGKDL
jgi:hypothetical protein